MRYRPRASLRAVLSGLAFAVLALLAVGTTPSAAARVFDLRTNQFETAGWIATGCSGTIQE